MREQRRKIQKFLTGAATHLAPSCADAFGAAIIERSGCEAVQLSGHAVHKNLCLPDAGLATASELESRITSIVEALRPWRSPLIVDGETGSGHHTQKRSNGGCRGAIS
jgi:2-methylisocitrate lyase-like PEP mutase family enzyme